MGKAFFGIILSIVLICFGFSSLGNDMDILSWIMIGCGALGGFGALSEFNSASMEYSEKKEINKNVKKGKWEFPCEEFYNKCKNVGITSFKDEFSIKKAQQIMIKILEENKVDEKYYSIYLEPKKMQELYEKGPKQTNERLKREQEEKNKEILKQKEIKEVKPNEENAKLIKNYAELTTLKGAKKREKMLSFTTEEKKKKYEEIYEQRKTVDRYSDYLYNKAEHNSSNWAIAGGIAEGLAGPAAGVAAAVDAMSKEPQIQEDNRILKESAIELKYTSMTQLSKMVDEAKRKYEEALAEEKNAKNKIVLSKPDGKEIAKYVSVEKTDFDRMDDGILKISAKVVLKESIKLNVPKGTKMVVDGVVSGKVFYEGKFVDDVKLVLPTYGITNALKQNVLATGYCTKSAEYKGNYTLEITDMTNLWVMEY
ncbi:MAG: hypothetical protein J6K97_01070 [Clostridia bacterium]|nr:hypothetical protein [Clostridia bacterium]